MPVPKAIRVDETPFPVVTVVRAIIDAKIKARLANVGPPIETAVAKSLLKGVLVATVEAQIPEDITGMTKSINSAMITKLLELGYGVNRFEVSVLSGKMSVARVTYDVALT